MIYSSGDEFVEWTKNRISEKLGFDNPFGMGVMTDNHEIVLGVVLDNYRIESNSICASFAISDKKTFSRKVAKMLFNTAFNLIGVNRVSVMIEKGNYKSIKAVETLGFEHEGVMRQASYNKNDLHVYGMLKSECKWI
jgi:hypothetical protein